MKKIIELLNLYHSLDHRYGISKSEKESIRREIRANVNRLSKGVSKDSLHEIKLAYNHVEVLNELRNRYY